MIWPTREELVALAARLRADHAGSDLIAAAQEAAQILDASPLPPEDGERERCIKELRAAAAELAQCGPSAIPAALRAMDRTASALLRQPPPPPVAGVSKEEAAALIKAAFRHLAFLPEQPARWQIRQAGENLVKAIEALPEAAPRATLQARVDPWLLECFGEEIARDGVERNHRFLEESLELAQSCGCTEEDARALVAYVYGRPKGDAYQEVGGVLITLAALCLAHGFDMHAAGEEELARIWGAIDKIRAKRASKPKGSPVPQAAAPPSAVDRKAAAEAARDLEALAATARIGARLESSVLQDWERREVERGASLLRQLADLPEAKP